MLLVSLTPGFIKPNLVEKLLEIDHSLKEWVFFPVGVLYNLQAEVKLSLSPA